VRRSGHTWPQVGGRQVRTAHGLTEGLVYVTSTQQVMPSSGEVHEADSAAAIKEHQPRTALDPLVIAAQRTPLLTEIRTCSTDDALVRGNMHPASQQSHAPAQRTRATPTTAPP